LQEIENPANSTLQEILNLQGFQNLVGFSLSHLQGQKKTLQEIENSSNSTLQGITNFDL